MKRTETFVIHFEGEAGQTEFSRLMDIMRDGAPGVRISCVSTGDQVKQLDKARELLYDAMEQLLDDNEYVLAEKIETFLDYKS